MADAAVLRVNGAAVGTPIDGSSWDQAYRSPSDALANAQSGDEIWVAEGTYTPAPMDGARTLSFQLKDGVAMYGGFVVGAQTRGERDPNAHPSVLSGDLNGNDAESASENSYHVVQFSEGEAVFDGFIVSGGNADGGDPNDSAAGINVTGGLLHLVHCTIENNLASVRGAGLCAINASVEITSSRIQSNEGGGGGGAFVMYGSLTLVQCMVLDNMAGLGGGVYAATNAQFTATNAVFGRNEAALSGGAVYVGAPCTASFLNCTIADNLSKNDEEIGAIIVSFYSVQSSSTATFENCVLHANLPRSLYVYSGSTCSVSNSIIEGGYSGTGNLDVDPRFRLVDEPPCQLSWDSPAIDAADASASATDVLGAARPMNGGPDIGAYEFGTDTDGGGLPDDYENANGLIASDPGDDSADSDQDHLDNREEFRRGTNPQDENDPPSKFYVGPSGNDITGDGSEDKRWRTIAHAMASVPEGTPVFPIAIYLAAGIYEERVVFRPYTYVVGASVTATTIKYYQASDDEHVVITAAEGCGLESCTVTFPASVTATAELLRIDDVAMEVHDVVFNGGDSPHAIAVFVTQPGSSNAIIRNSTIKRVEYGVFAVDSGINVTQNTFEDIFEGAIFIRPPTGKAEGETPMLGSTDTASATGFNRFNMSSGFFIKNEAGDDVSAQYNDWGVYSDSDISSRISGGAGKAGSVTFKPYIGRSLVDASLVIAVESQATNEPVESKYAPKAAIGVIAPTRDLTSSLFIFPSLSGGIQLVQVSANSHTGQSRNVTVKPGEIVVETFTLAYTGGEGEGEGEGCVHSAGAMAEPPAGPNGNGFAYMVMAGLLLLASWTARFRSGHRAAR